MATLIGITVTRLLCVNNGSVDEQQWPPLYGFVGVNNSTVTLLVWTISTLLQSLYQKVRVCSCRFVGYELLCWCSFVGMNDSDLVSMALLVWKTLTLLVWTVVILLVSLRWCEQRWSCSKALLLWKPDIAGVNNVDLIGIALLVWTTVTCWYDFFGVNNIVFAVVKNSDVVGFGFVGRATLTSPLWATVTSLACSCVTWERRIRGCCLKGRNMRRGC